MIYTAEARICFFLIMKMKGHSQRPPQARSLPGIGCITDFLTVESEKMSKSLGNFILIKDALRDYHPEVLRFFLLSKQYRSPLDFAKKDVQDFQAGLIRIYRTLQRLEGIIGPEENSSADIQGLIEGDQDNEFINKFIALMDDDLNTAGAIGIIFDKNKELNRIMDEACDNPPDSVKEQLKDERQALLNAATVLGILTSDPSEFISQIEKPSDIDESEIEDLIKQRTDARTRKDWPRADAIRDKLQEMGIVLEDKAGVTKWRKEV